MNKYAPCWNCGGTRVWFTGNHVRIALCGDCRVRLLTPEQAATLKEAQRPTVPEPEPSVDPDDTKPVQIPFYEHGPDSCDMFGHIWTDLQGSINRQCVRCGDMEF